MSKDIASYFAKFVKNDKRIDYTVKQQLSEASNLMTNTFSTNLCYQTLTHLFHQKQLHSNLYLI